MKLNKNNKYSNAKNLFIAGCTIAVLSTGILKCYNDFGLGAKLNNIIGEESDIQMTDLVTVDIIKFNTDNGNRFVLGQYVEKGDSYIIFDVESRKKMGKTSEKSTFKEIFSEYGEYVSMYPITFFFEGDFKIKDNYTYDEVIQGFNYAKEHYDEIIETKENRYEKYKYKDY